MSQENIFSNAGSLGIERRQDNRLYANAEDHFDNASQAEELFSVVQNQADNMQDITRIVMRGIISDRGFQEFSDGRFGRHLEAAIDLSEHGHEGVLMYVGQNLPQRGTTHEPIQRMVEETEASQVEHVQRPLSSLLSGGDDIELRRSLAESELPQLMELWGDTFGWSQEELEAYMHRLNPNSSDVWFAGVFGEDNLLISAAMGERIDLIGRNGPVTLVENTEWSTRPNGFRGRGYMSMAVSAIGAQALSALAESPNGPPVLYAECNYASRSDRVALNAGYHIPERNLAQQILPQHVTVRDRIWLPGLRDFTVVSLPSRSIDTLYDADSLEQINERLIQGS